jgi:hypothetical protein
VREGIFPRACARKGRCARRACTRAGLAVTVASLCPPLSRAGDVTSALPCSGRRQLASRAYARACARKGGCAFHGVFHGVPGVSSRVCPPPAPSVPTPEGPPPGGASLARLRGPRQESRDSSVVSPPPGVGPAFVRSTLPRARARARGKAGVRHGKVPERGECWLRHPPFRVTDVDDEPAVRGRYETRSGIARTAGAKENSCSLTRR